MKYNQRVKMLGQIIGMGHEFFKELDLGQDNPDSEKNVDQVTQRSTHNKKSLAKTRNSEPCRSTRNKKFTETN